jgi:hypothetical protein
MAKKDYRKELKHLYAPSASEVTIVEVPTMAFLMIDGQGDPSTSREYQAAIEALYSVAYTLKFAIKKGEGQVDYAVFPLESLWWADDISAFMAARRDEWKWTAMIAQPEYVTRALFESAVTEVKKKKGGLSAIGLMRFKPFAEGKAAQIMHIGPFSEEAPTVEKVHAAIGASGGSPSGKHHEIYLSDFRKTSPDKLKTVIRQPFKMKS